jgi:hypothetical protein
MLASLPASSCHCCRCYAGVVPLAARASPPCCASIFSLVAPCIAASVYKLASAQPAAVLAYVASLPSTRHRQWVCCHPIEGRMQRWRLCQRCAGILARMLLASLQVLHYYHCRRCAGVDALAAQASSPLSCWRCQSCCTLVAASIPNWRPLVATQSQPIGIRDIVTILIAIDRGPLLYSESSTATGPSTNATLVSLPVLRWHPCLRCAGIIASIALSSLPALRCHRCRRCTGVVACLLLASLPSLHLHCRLHRPCIGASIANWRLPNLDAATTHPRTWRCCRGHFPCSCPCCHTWRCSTATLLSMVRLMQRWHLCQRCACNTRWRHHQHRAVVVAGVTPASLPSLRWRCHPRYTRVAASIMNWHLPIHDTDATRCR